MTELKPILQSRPSPGMQRLLGSARLDVPRPGGVTRTVAALGLASGVTATAGVSAASATSSAAIVAKWLVIGAATGAVVTGTGEAVRYRIDASRESRAQAHDVARTRAVPVRATSGREASPEAPSTLGAVRPAEALPTEAVPAGQLPRSVGPARPSNLDGRPVIRPVVVGEAEHPQTTAPEPTLAEEVRALDDVRRALAIGDANGALRSLDEVARRFARPRLGPEAALLRTQATAALRGTSDTRPLVHEP